MREDAQTAKRRKSVLVWLPMWMALVDFALVMYSVFSVKSFSTQAHGLMVWMGILLCLGQLLTSIVAALAKRQWEIFIEGFAVSMGGLILFGLAMPA